MTTVREQRTEPDPATVAFGAFLAAVRVQHGLSQREVADVMGTRQSSISEMETGVHGPQVDTMIRFLVAVGRALGRREVAEMVEAPRLPCPVCSDAPPAGFACTRCGAR